MNVMIREQIGRPLGDASCKDCLLYTSLIGAVFEAATEGSSLPDNAVLFLKTGVCGGFTTFSAFSLETLALLERGKYATGALYACGSVLACLAGVVIGRLAVRGVRAALTGSAAA